MTRSDLLIINKIDLAPHVGASLEVMERDSRRMRGERPFQFAQVRDGVGVPEVVAFIETAGGLPRRERGGGESCRMRPAESRSGAVGETVDDGYILERTEAEYARLQAQARAWEAVTLRVLAAAGLAPGMRCLDAGCGPGEAMRLLGRGVGPEGHVTGLDIDAALGRHMLAELRREEGPNFDFVAGDITRSPAVPGAPFDLVFARLLLCHMTDPVAAVRALAAQLRPGGRLVLMDYDMSRLAARPEDARLTRAFEVIVQSFERSGRRADAGLRLAEFLLAAGLPPPAGSDVAGLYAPIRVLGPMVRGVIASLAQGAAALGIADAAEIDALTAHVAALEAEDRHVGLGPLMIGVWTTLPA